MKFPNRIRYFNKHVLNRATLRIAGAAYSPIAAVQHVGRRSGKPYETPVIVEPFADGFVFALTYGPKVDWYRNVLAAGECGLRWHGGTYRLTNPEPIRVEAALPAFPPLPRLILRTVGIQHFFKMEKSAV